MLNSFRTKTSCEIEAKFIQDRIISVEKNISELCYVFAAFSRKAARLRDKTDEIAKTSISFAANEDINKSLAVGLENFAESLSLLGDYGDARVQLIDNKVVNEFSRYEDVCKQVKDDVKNIYTARDKEVNRRKQLDRARERNPRSRQLIVQAETELVKATAEVSKTVLHLEEKVTTFEKQKIHDVKSILLDFIATELGYHAKALETLTKAFEDINSVNEEADLEEFKKTLRSSDKELVGKPSMVRSVNRFGSLGSLFSTSKGQKPLGIPNSSKKFSKSEETLDSMKQSFSESEVTDSDAEEISDNTSEMEPRKSPIIVKRYQK